MTQVQIQDASGNLVKEITIDSEKPILSQAEKQGVEIPNACRSGMCAACMCHIKNGDEYAVKDLRGEPAFPLGEGELMTCIGGVVDTDETIILQTMN